MEYTIKFDVGAAGSAAAFVIDFCSNSPLVGSACTAPTGLNVNTPTVVSGATSANKVGSRDNTVRVVKAIANSESVEVTLGGLSNPTVVGPLYARILTYGDAGVADSYEPAIPGAFKDYGGIANYITNEIGIGADVLETMTFCVSAPNPLNGSNPITGPGCDGAETPSIEIGEVTGPVRALATTALSTNAIFTRLSTNAVNGAVVYLKSDATNCGGLKLVGGADTDCIAPATADFSLGTANFGLRLSAESDGTNPTGTVQAINGYSSSSYLLNAALDNLTGVTSTYGDAIFDTDGAAVNERGMKLTFGASIDNSTAAGRYAAKMSLIATGTF